jgi:hypothetical protein
VLASIGDFMVANAVLPAAQGSTCKTNIYHKKKQTVG